MQFLLLLLIRVLGIIMFTSLSRRVVRSLSTTGSCNLSTISNKACFGAGCYWGTERYFKKDFGVKVFPGSGKVVEGNVGFMGPATAKKDPSYKEVCTGTTGHVEVYDLKFEGGETAYENLVKHFFMFHDPTTLNRQGNDRGTQYASAIFVYDDKQKEIATRVKKELQELIYKSKIPGYQNKEVVTHITEATTFYPAHEEHQEYLEKNPGGYCNHGYRFSHWPNNGN